MDKDEWLEIYNKYNIREKKKLTKEKIRKNNKKKRYEILEC
jgi:hypothetical protein